jgi:hypothetical protein
VQSAECRVQNVECDTIVAGRGTGKSIADCGVRIADWTHKSKRGARPGAGTGEPARGGQAGEPANAERPSFVICQGLEGVVDDGCGNDILAEGKRHRRAGSKR